MRKPRSRTLICHCPSSKPPRRMILNVRAPSLLLRARPTLRCSSLANSRACWPMRDSRSTPPRAKPPRKPFPPNAALRPMSGTSRVRPAASRFRIKSQRRSTTFATLGDTLEAKADDVQEQTSALLSAAQQNWQNHLAGELEAAQGRLQIAVDNAIAAAQGQGAESLNQHANAVLAQFQQEAETVQAGIRESTARAASESDSRLATLRDATQAHAERMEATLAHATEVLGRLELFPERVESAQQHALSAFQSQLDDVLKLHRNELHRRSDSLFEEISARIRSTFAQSSPNPVPKFGQQVESLVQPHLLQVEQGIHRMAGGRSMLDAATSLQQERIRVSADQAFAEAFANFSGKLGGI